MNLVVGKPMAGTPSALQRIRVRPATAGDRGFAMSLVPRLVATSAAHWRIPRKVHAAYVAVIESILGSARNHSVLLIGERETAMSMGIALLSTASDCFTHRHQGHLVQVVVPKSPEDSVEARALIEATKNWARSHGLIVLPTAGFWNSHPVAALCTWTGNGRPASSRKTPSITRSEK